MIVMYQRVPVDPLASEPQVGWGAKRALVHIKSLLLDHLNLIPSNMIETYEIALPCQASLVRLLSCFRSTVWQYSVSSSCICSRISLVVDWQMPAYIGVHRLQCTLLYAA